MAILTMCPGCARKLKIRDDLAGRTIRCPKCAAAVAVKAAAPPADSPTPEWQETIPIISAAATKPASRRPPAAAPPSKSKPAKLPEPSRRPVRKEPEPEPAYVPEPVDEDDHPPRDDDRPRKRKKK